MLVSVNVIPFDPAILFLEIHSKELKQAVHKDIEGHPEVPIIPSKVGDLFFFYIVLPVAWNPPFHPCPSSHKTRTHPWVQRSATPSCLHSNLVTPLHNSATYLSLPQQTASSPRTMVLCIYLFSVPALPTQQCLTHRDPINMLNEGIIFLFIQTVIWFPKSGTFKRLFPKMLVDFNICYIKVLYDDRYSSKANSLINLYKQIVCESSFVWSLVPEGLKISILGQNCVSQLRILSLTVVPRNRL